MSWPLIGLVLPQSRTRFTRNRAHISTVTVMICTHARRLNPSNVSVVFSAGYSSIDEMCVVWLRLVSRLNDDLTRSDPKALIQTDGDSNGRHPIMQRKLAFDSFRAR